MSGVFDPEQGRSRSPGIADIGARAKELVMIPVPILRVLRGGEGKGGKMETHPATAILYIFFERDPLPRVVRTGIQEYHYLVADEKTIIHITPVIGGVIGEMIFFCHFREPAVCFVYK